MIKLGYFISSSIISGIIWDILKGFSLNIIEKIIKNIIGKDILEQLQNVAINLPAENKKTKRDFIKKLRVDSEFNKIYFEHKINVIGLCVSLFLTLLVVSIIFIAFYKAISVFVNNNDWTIENKYVTGKYKGLKRLDMDCFPSQHMDSFFYENKKEFERGNYIRVTKFMIETCADDYFLEDRKTYATAGFVAQLISCCEIYAADHLRQDALSDKCEFVKGEQGVFFAYFTQGEYNENVVNTVVYRGVDDDGNDYFLLVKCLFVEGDGMMVIILSHHGDSYESFINSEKKAFVNMRKCFYSFKQVCYN